MKKWWVPIVVMVVVAGASGYLLWQSKTIPSDSVLPSELNEKFDPTVNVAMFKMIEMVGGNRVKLEYATPQAMKGKQIESELVCEAGIKLRERGRQYFTQVAWEMAQGKIASTTTPILFHGLCQDKKCSKIIGECYIYLN